MRVLIFGLACIVTSAGLMAREATVVTVTPRRTDELLANPGIGWQTFHRTRVRDESLPDWIPSTMHYARWGWGRFEPRPGKIDTKYLDGVLAETRAAGQALAFRVMCCSSSPRDPYYPAWLEGVGGRIVRTRYGNGPSLTVPDLDDPTVLARHLDFIERLGKRYDGHPDIDHVDLGSVGWWGEWHMSNAEGISMPTRATRKAIVDAYFAAFEKTRLVMLMGGGEMLTYAARHGAGWRADCLGDMGGFSKTWCHMRKGYPGWLRTAGVLEAWKTAPVMWESCWDMRRWVEEDWPLRFIFNYALALHGSQLNNKSAPLPEGEEVRSEIERFLCRFGYRLVLEELVYPASARAGGEVSIRMKWRNTGSAPCYRPYRVAYRLAGRGGYAKVIVGGVAVNEWMPGSVPLFTDEFFEGRWDLPEGPVVEVSDAVSLPDDVPPGEYELALAVVGETSTEPAIRLGIAGRGEDGWYALGTMRVGD